MCMGAAELFAPPDVGPVCEMRAGEDGESPSRSFGIGEAVRFGWLPVFPFMLTGPRIELIWLPLAELAGGVILLTTGREVTCAGGAAAARPELLPALCPSTLSRVGVALTRFNAGAFRACCGETFRALRFTGSELTSAFFGTAVNPPGTCMLA